MGQWEGYKICVLFYNFVKEYLEELFNYNELSHIADVQRVYPKWFYELPEAKDLLLSKSFSLECLGLGFNALNGVTIVAMLARIDDTRLSNLIKEKINANWEVAKRTTESPSIEFVDYKSPKLETWLLEMKYSTASAFSISRAIERLTEL
jgi:hypothetical protein